MSSNLSTGRTLELIERLKAALEGFAVRADKLNSELRTRVARQRQLCEKSLQQNSAEAEAAMGKARVGFEAAVAEREQRYGSRKARIGRAYQNSKEAGLQRIEQEMGGRKYELQKLMLQAERNRDNEYAQAGARLQELRAALADEERRLSALEFRCRAAFKWYRTLLRTLGQSYEHSRQGVNKSEDALLSDLRSLLDEAEGLERACRSIVGGAFRYIPIWLCLALLPIGVVAWQRQNGTLDFTYGHALAVSGGIFAFAMLGRLLAVRLMKPRATRLARVLASARQTFEACSAKTEGGYTNTAEAVRDLFLATSEAADRDLKQAMVEAGQKRVTCRMSADERAVQAGAFNERQHSNRLAALNAAHRESVAGLTRTFESNARSLQQECDDRIADLTSASNLEWDVLVKEWEATVPPIFDLLTSAKEAAQALFPPWEGTAPDALKLPAQFVNAAQYGRLQVDLAKVCSMLPQDRRLALPGPQQIEAPLCLTYPSEGSLLLETHGPGREEAIGSLNNVILRLLAGSPPGRVNFTILDPVGLGQSFAGIMHMADYEEQIINNRIWTQSAQIEEKLAELNEHMEKVIQMYLRNEYATIAEYNEQAGVIAEKYHFLVVADFPSGFTDSAVRRLLSIAASGPRCGVSTLIHWDRRQQLPADFPISDLRQCAISLAWRGAEFSIVGKALDGTRIQLDAPPSADRAIEFVHHVGKASKDSSRVEVPFEHVAPAEPHQVWSEDTSSELRVAIGRTGATKLQYLAIGKGTRQHGLVAGKTGSGKSTLFHVAITNLGLWCSPEQVEFYLVDFKKGVEFKCYATKRLPHARVVAIESDREFGLSVLQRVDEELKRRGDLFRQLGVQDIPGYKRAGGSEPLPRCLLLIDEFQEFFVEDDKIAQTASLLLDRIVRQGRAFGIHVLLGSQTLGGAYTVARTTLGQMVIRIALQCNEADAHLIFDDDNPAPRLLSRPGEAIYNDAAGAIEGNSPFQVVWLPDGTRDQYLEKIRAHAEETRRRYPGPIVFEGNAPSDVQENEILREVLEKQPPVGAPATPRIWLGAPNSIKGPTEVGFQRQSGNNLLIVGQRDEAILTMFALGAVSLAAQFPPGGCEVFLIDGSAPGTPPREYLDALVAAAPRGFTLVRPNGLSTLMSSLRERKEKLAASPEAETGPVCFVMIHGLQRFAKLRFEDEFSFSSTAEETEPAPGAILNELLSDGPRLGFHVMASCDSYNNVNRFLTRKALSEFEMRVVFQMSANDSASLIDTPRASVLGLHRALFFNAQEGHVETFRPYALPPLPWIREVASGWK